MTVYDVLGVDDGCHTCEACGKTNLKKCIVLGLLDADENVVGEVRYGCDCAALAYKGKKTRKNADALWTLATQEQARQDGRRFGLALGEAMLVDVAPLKMSDGVIVCHEARDPSKPVGIDNARWVEVGFSSFAPVALHWPYIQPVEAMILNDAKALLVRRVIVDCCAIAFPSGADPLNQMREQGAIHAAHEVLATYKPKG